MGAHSLGGRRQGAAFQFKLWLIQYDKRKRAHVFSSVQIPIHLLALIERLRPAADPPDPPRSPSDPPRFWNPYGLNPQNSLISNFTSTYFFSKKLIFFKEFFWRLIFTNFYVFRTFLTRPVSFSHHFNSDWCRKHVRRQSGGRFLSRTSRLRNPHCVSGRHIVSLVKTLCLW